MSLHPYNIEQKTEVIVEHFRRNVLHRLGGRAKAMVVTSSRLHAVRYKLAFERYLEENGYTGIRPLVAFSGTVRDPETGVEYTEPGMNTDAVTGKPISESALPERFASPDYQVLLVANKYQTGFDQPPALCDVRGQAPGRCAGGADVVAAEPDDSRQGCALRAGFRQRRRGHLPCVQTVLRQDRAGRAFGTRPFWRH